MKYTVHITQDDIDKGRRYSNVRCPIYRAIRREVGLREFQVTALDLSDVCEEGFAQLPKKVKRWIMRYDENGAACVRPFAFVLHLDGFNAHMHLPRAVRLRLAAVGRAQVAKMPQKEISQTR